jgi:hypothetical protein
MSFAEILESLVDLVLAAAFFGIMAAIVTSAILIILALPVVLIGAFNKERDFTPWIAPTIGTIFGVAYVGLWIGYWADLNPFADTNGAASPPTPQATSDLSQEQAFQRCQRQVQNQVTASDDNTAPTPEQIQQAINECMADYGSDGSL